MGKLVFCYWKVRGLGQPVINMFEYSGFDYEYKPVPTTSVEVWLAEKFTLGLDFPNLPYIIDDDVRLTESWAIYKYVAKKTGLMPPTGDEYDRQSDMVQGVIHEIRSNFASSCYKPDFYSVVETVLENNCKKFDMLEKYLKSRKFLVGKLTYLDFALYETLDQQRLFSSDILSKYPNLTAYMKRFESLDRINAYFKSDRYHQFPITAHHAQWGGQDRNDKK